jgi:hypothetical protein
MNKKNVIEQLREHGAVAGHLNNRYVEVVRDVPRRVTFALPLFQDRPKLKKGDKIAIVDMEDQVAHLCRISSVTAMTFGAPIFELEGARKLKLE